MGVKLESFLRVMASGLSPQAAQANTALYAAEEAGIRTKERDDIAQNRASEDANFKSVMGNVALKVTAAKEANKAGDRVAHDKIIAGIPGTVRNSGLSQQRQNLALNAGANEYIEGMSKPKTEKTAVMFDLPQGGSVPAVQRGTQFIYRNEKGEEVNLPYGSVESAKKSLQGDLTKSQSGKLRVEGIEGEANVSKLIAGIDDYIKIISSPDFVGGNIGEALGNIDSVLSQVQQVTGNKGYLTENGEVDFDKLDLSKDNISFLEKAAGQTGLASSQMLQLAAVVAIANNPSGRVSDKDLEIAKRILGESANPKVAAKLLGALQNKLILNYNIGQRAVSRAQNKKYKNLTLEGLRGLTGKRNEAAAVESKSRKDSRASKYGY